jgi:pyrimidine deaminase RibD-like protein
LTPIRRSSASTIEPERASSVGSDACMKESKVIVITGASSGIGAALAEVIAPRREGHRARRTTAQQTLRPRCPRGQRPRRVTDLTVLDTPRQIAGRSAVIQATLFRIPPGRAA